MPNAESQTPAKFRSRVLSVVRRIPAGRVATYGDIAAAAGSPRAARAVGNIMRECRSAGVPCHRVIAANGRLGGYGGLVGLECLDALKTAFLERGSVTSLDTGCLDSIRRPPFATAAER